MKLSIRYRIKRYENISIVWNGVMIYNKLVNVKQPRWDTGLGDEHTDRSGKLGWGRAQVWDPLSKQLQHELNYELLCIRSHQMPNRSGLDTPLLQF